MSGNTLKFSQIKMRNIRGFAKFDKLKQFIGESESGNFLDTNIVGESR